MAKAGFCGECRRNVWLTPDGGCQLGHSASTVRDVHEVAVTAQDVKDSQSGVEETSRGAAGPTCVPDLKIEAYRRDKRLAGPMTISAAQPMKTTSDSGRLEPSPPLSRREAANEAQRLLQEPASFTLEPVWNRTPYTHHLRVIEGPADMCLDYLVEVRHGT